MLKRVFLRRKEVGMCPLCGKAVYCKDDFIVEYMKVDGAVCLCKVHNACKKSINKSGGQNVK